MPSAANGKTEKPASSEAADNSPIRQIMTVIEHKIRNLEKRKGKLTSYRDLQKAGKELHADQKVAVAKYDEVVQTLEFARDLSKQISGIAISAEKESKKQAKKEAWVRYASETTKIREVLLIIDCLMQMGTPEVRDDFLNGTNGAAKLTEQELKVLDDLYPEVTPKHDLNEEGQPGFHAHAFKAAEHLYAIIDGKQKEVLGTTYSHIKAIVTAVHECGYFDKPLDSGEPEANVEQEVAQVPPEEQIPIPVAEQPAFPPPNMPPPPVPTGLPQPGYPIRAMPPITLQEVEHAYFAQQYPQQRPISEVIGSQNFFFLQESEIESPDGTPAPGVMSPAAIPSQTFTNQHYVIPRGAPEPGALPLPPHFPPAPPAHPAYPAAALPHLAPLAEPSPATAPAAHSPPRPVPSEDKSEWKDDSPEREHNGDRKTQTPADGQGRYKRYGRGGPRGATNGYRGRGGFHSRQNSDGYHRQSGDYQGGRGNKDGYGRQYGNSDYRHKDNYRGGDRDNFYGNGDSGNGQRDNGDGHAYGGFKSRGRGGAARRPARTHFSRNRSDNAE